MGLLLYKSDEMYSSTELIRKSKMIFNKVLNNDIEKAIILRDGKPSFLLMEFKKYEKIMSEFEELKEQIKSIKTTKQKKSKLKSVDTDKDKLKNELIKQSDRISIEAVDYTKPKTLSKPEPKIETTQPQDIQEKPENILSEEDEIKTALKSIESMNFNDEMKKVAQDKIKAKIIEARKIRAEQLALQEQNSQEEDQEELTIKQHIEEEKVKKERELKEFWD